MEANEVDERATTAGEARELASWRRAIMPFAILVLIAYSGFFAWTSYVQFSELSTSIAKSLVEDDLRQVIIVSESEDVDRDSSQLAVPHVDMAALERKVRLGMDERKERANLIRAGSSLMLSLWTRNMGFLTGMILAMVGAVFVLSRLDDAGSDLAAEQGSFKASLKTSSPGIVLAVLGTLLMMMAMLVRYSEEGSHIEEANGQAAAPEALSRRPSPPPPSEATCRQLPETEGCQGHAQAPAAITEPSQ